MHLNIRRHDGVRSTRSLNRIALLILALAAALTFAVAGANAAPVPSVVYNAIPSPLPPNMASLGFQATQTSEFGDYVHLAGTDRNLKTVTVTMSDWALYSDYALDARYAANSSTWTHPITLNLYNAVPGNPNQRGTLIGTVTQTITIPWRPAADPTCPGGTAWRAGDGQCYNGLAFNATFDFSSLGIVLPNNVIVGVAFNTQSYGTTPLVVNGPYNSLNVGVEGAATVGTDDNTDRVFWNTSTAAWYSDGGPGGTFREDTNWAPYGTVAIQITAAANTVGPPTSKDQCKNGGWQSFNNPSFKNQGDCIQYFNTGK
jgi:hypothetical protein